MLLWDISRIVFIHFVNNDNVLWTLEHIIHNEEALREGKKLCCKWGRQLACSFLWVLQDTYAGNGQKSSLFGIMWMLMKQGCGQWWQANIELGKQIMLKIMHLWSHWMSHSNRKTHYQKCWICTKRSKEKTRPFLSSIIDSYSNKFLMAR
jgi:hypothetical protein